MSAAFRIQDEGPVAVQAETVVAHVDGRIFVHRVPEDVKVPAEEMFAVEILLDIGPDGAADSVLATPVPRGIGEGGEKQPSRGRIPVQHLVQALRAEAFLVENVPVTLDPVLRDTGVREQHLPAAHLPDMDDVEQIQVVLEHLFQLCGATGIPPAGTDVRIQITQVMIAKQEHDIAGVFLFEVNDVQKPLVCLAGKNALPGIRIHVIPKEDNPILLVSLDGAPPEIAAMHVGYDDTL